MKTVVAIAVLASVVACSGSAALACSPGKDAYVKNGEQYCYSTSDGPGQGYTRKSSIVTTIHGSRVEHTHAYQAALLAQLRKHHFY